MGLFQTDKGEWGVRWREGGRYPSRVIGTKAQAREFEAAKKLARRTGGLVRETSKLTLAEWMDEWYERKARTLTENSRLAFESAIRLHIKPLIGGYKLAEITPETLDEWLDYLEGRGIGAPRRRQVLAVLSGSLKAARKKRLIAYNPCQDTDNPRVERKRAIRPIPLTVVEEMREHILSGEPLPGKTVRIGAEWERRRDAAMLGTLAYCGPRPAEVRALTWPDLRERTILIDKARPIDSEQETKNRKHRAVPLPSQHRQELLELRMAGKRLSKFIFPRADGTAWTKKTFDGWRGTVWNPLIRHYGKPYGLEDQTPYALRHTFATLLVYSGEELPTVAYRMGDSLDTVLEHYVHVMADFDPANRKSLDEQITEARDKSGSSESAVVAGATE